MVEFLVYLFVFLFGIVFGSFYNVVIYRLPIDISVAKGRSFCPNCKHSLKAIDLVPVLSQLLLKNKCRYCGQKISLRYPSVELATGVLFVISYIVFGATIQFIMFAIFYSILLITMMIDFDHMLICDSLIFTGAGAALICIAVGKLGWKDHLLGLLVGFVIYLLIYGLAKLIYKQEAFGFGDVMLMGMMGLYLGLAGSIFASLLSFVVAAVGMVIMKIAGKKISSKVEVPFGPYMCIAGFITSIFGDKIISSYMAQF